MADLVGKSILHYRILEHVGQGGMGVVYKAEDTKLKREVAIKFLPRKIAASDEERERFRIEAQAAAALNHNNIATIYNIEEEDGETFIVMEYIKGRELKDRIAQGPLQVNEVYSLAIQIAKGLQAAHEEGIVHRDIKSSNIMLTHKGDVKIMDFGLAKVAGSAQLTKIGTTLGTAAYMSPEQARGEEADQRSDIWAFGVVLYEMLTGKYPFAGDYEQAVVFAILNEQPEQLDQVKPEASGFQHIIDKALTKNREVRYQSISELLDDLQDVRGPGNETRRISYKSVTSKSRSPRNRQKTLVIGLSIAAALILAIIALWKTGLIGQKRVRPFQNMQITRLTSTGKTTSANISPDGNYIVHALHDKDKSSLWVRQIATGSDVQILPPADVEFVGTTFSHDGNYIYYVMSDLTLYRIPTLGGVPEKILSNITSSVTLSPDGKQFSFVRQFSGQGEEALMIANIDGSAQRKLASRMEPEFFVGDELPGPSWSPDGRLIACGAGSVAGEWRMGVIVVSVEDGKQELLFNPKKHFEIGRVAWLYGGRNLVFGALDTTSLARKQLWQVDYPDGDLRRVTNDLNSYDPRSLGLTADGSSLVTVQEQRTSNIWLVPNFYADNAEQLSFSTGTDEGVSGVCLTPNEQILFSSVESGNPDIWIMDKDGKNKRRLTTDPAPDLWPSVGSDGRNLVFASDRGDMSHVWKMDLSSGDLVQLTEREDYRPSISWDGKWIVYWGFRPGAPGMSGAAYAARRISIDGGQPVQLTEKLALDPVISPNGKLIACRYRDQPNGPFLLAILPFEGGQPTRLFNIPPWVERLVWSADSRGVMYVDTRTGVSNIMKQPITGGEPEKITNFQNGTIFSFAVSHDGKTLVCARGSLISDVVLIRDVK